MVIKETISTPNVCHKQGTGTLSVLFKEATIISSDKFKVIFICFLHLFRRMIHSHPLRKLETT